MAVLHCAQRCGTACKRGLGLNRCRVRTGCETAPARQSAYAYDSYARYALHRPCVRRAVSRISKRDVLRSWRRTSKKCSVNAASSHSSSTSWLSAIVWFSFGYRDDIQSQLSSHANYPCALRKSRSEEPFLPEFCFAFPTYTFSGTFWQFFIGDAEVPGIASRLPLQLLWRTAGRP